MSRTAIAFSHGRNTRVHTSNCAVVTYSEESWRALSLLPNWPNPLCSLFSADHREPCTLRVLRHRDIGGAGHFNRAVMDLASG